MSERICGTCRHWERDSYSDQSGWCRLTHAEGDATEDFHEYPESIARVQVFEPDDAPYKATLWTHRVFGCTQWQETTRE